jgi:phenylalanyl-tRNA synthetase beta chain
MKASYRWLRELVPNLNVTPEELAARLTAGGIEVEGQTRFGAAAASCVIVQVKGVRPHPQRSGLRLVTVDRGAGAGELEIVCGAPNVPDPGGLVVLAPLGTHLPAKGMTIERRAIGGITSEGMLCSEEELGLSDDAAGIIVLPRDFAQPGTRFTDAIPGADDVIYEIGLTPNRPDGLGHVGLARELAALFDVPWAPPAIEPPARVADLDVASLAQVQIGDLERCSHYGAAGVVDVAIGPSPAWLRYRLASLGVRPISNVVDITNLVMLEYAHPMHAFDLDRVRGGKIVVRRAQEGEKLKTLDGVERALIADDLLICDADGPVGLAGVMGGADSEIRASTRRVLFECAYFMPRGVRRTARRNALHTEASYRFERGVDPGDVSAVLARAISLTTRLAGGAAARGEIHAGERTPKKTIVSLRSSRLDQLLGEPVPWAEALGVLARLGFETRKEGAGVVELDAPTHRPDIAREVDLIEEVARVRGIDRVKPVLPAIRPTRDEGPREELARRVRAAAVETGLSEALTFAFVAPAELEALGAPPPAVTLKNPLVEQQSVMRTSLLPGLLTAVSRARRHGERDVRLFTVGAVYLAPPAGASAGDGLPDERVQFAAVLAGHRPAYLTKAAPVDVWDGKGLAEGMVQRLARRPAVIRALAPEERPRHLHPRGAAGIYVDGARVGTLGPLHPDVVDQLDMDEGCVVVEIEVDRLTAIARALPAFQPIARFPASTRDLSVVVRDDIPAGQVEAAVREVAGALAEDVCIFDRFVGGAIRPEHASLAFRVVYRAADRTLTDAEVDQQHAKVLAEIGRRFGAQLRT